MRVCPGLRMPSFSASSIMARAIRSFTEPPGFWPSSLIRMRTSGFGLSWLMSTSGVLPISSSTEPCAVIAWRRRVRDRAPGNRREDGDLVAIGDRSGQRRQVTDVVVIQIDVDELVERPVIVDHLAGKPRVLLDQRQKGLAHRGAGGGDGFGTAGMGTEDGRQIDLDGHGISSDSPGTGKS